MFSFRLSSWQICCICLTRYMDDEELRELPCTHFFHAECVDRWLKINATCPLCKFEICEREENTTPSETHPANETWNKEKGGKKKHTGGLWRYEDCSTRAAKPKLFALRFLVSFMYGGTFWVPFSWKKGKTEMKMDEKNGFWSIILLFAFIFICTSLCCRLSRVCTDGILQDSVRCLYRW